jgi:hypothetical protein
LQLMVDCATLGSEEGVAAAGGRVVLGAAAPEIDCCYYAHCFAVIRDEGGVCDTRSKLGKYACCGTG